MKVEILAGLLEKPANELQELLELADGVTDVDDSVAAEHISGHLKSIFSKGKEEGKGWGSKEAFKSIQKTLKEEFEIDTKDAIEGIKSLKEKVEQAKGSGSPDEKLKRENEILKQKALDLETKFNQFQEKEVHKQKVDIVSKKLDKIINDKFGEASEALKNLAKKELLNSTNWDVDGDDITLFGDKERTQLLKIDGKYASIDDVAVNIFKDILPPKTPTKKIPPRPEGKGDADDNDPKGETLGELYAELRKAKTSEARAAIQTKIDKISKQK